MRGRTWKPCFVEVKYVVDARLRLILEAALRVDAPLRVAQRAAADVRGKDFHVPGLGKFQRLAKRDGDRIRFLAGRAARAPNPQRARILPELPLLQLRQDSFLESRVDCRITEKRRLLRQQAFEQSFVLDARAAHEPQQIGPVRQAFFVHVLADASREESLARSIEQDRGALFDQRANLIKLGFGKMRGRNWMRFHGRRSAPASCCRLAEFAVNESLPPAQRAGSHRTLRAWPATIPTCVPNGTGPAPH